MSRYLSTRLGVIMFKNLPKQVFGNIQSKLFPWYFRINTVCNLSILLALLKSHAAEIHFSKPFANEV